MFTTVSKHLKLHHTALVIWYTIYYIAQFRGCINFRLKSLNKRKNGTIFEKFLKVYSFIMLQFTYYYSWLIIIIVISTDTLDLFSNRKKSFRAQELMLSELYTIVIFSSNVIIVKTLRKNQERIKIIIIEFRRIEAYIRRLCYCSYYLDGTQMCLISLRWIFIIFTSMTSILIKTCFIPETCILLNFYIISYELCYHAHLLCIVAITHFYRALNTFLCDYLRLLVRAPGEPPKFPLKLIKIERLIQNLHFKISECAAPFFICIYNRLFLSCNELYDGMKCYFFATHLSTANRRGRALLAVPFIISEFLEICIISYAADMLHTERQRFQAQLLEIELHLARLAYKRRCIQDTRRMLVLEHELQWTSLHSKISCISVSAYGALLADRSTTLAFLNATLTFTIPFLQYLVAELKTSGHLMQCRVEYIWETFNCTFHRNCQGLDD